MYKLRRLFAAAIALLFLLISTLPAAAQENANGSGLSISPTNFEFTLQPGQSDVIKINLKNITLNKIIAQPKIYDFTSDNVSGNPKIITDQSIVSPNSIRKFVSNLDDIPLDVGQQKQVILSLQIPKDTTPGAYYGVVRYKAVPAGPNAPKPGDVALSASVGSIVLVTVPGNIREQVQLNDLHIYRGGYDGTIFFNKPGQIGVEIVNLGNGFVKPFGTVEVKDMRGKVVYTYQLNSSNPRANVLPNSKRIFTDPLKNISSPGRYTVTASVSYGNGSQVLTLKKTFWYIPLWLALTILAILIILAFLAWRAYRRYKHDRKHAYRRKG